MLTTAAIWATLSLISFLYDRRVNHPQPLGSQVKPRVSGLPPFSRRKVLDLQLGQVVEKISKEEDMETPDGIS